MSNWHGGKGSSQRPTDSKKFSDNWDRIFGKKTDDPVKFCEVYKEEGCAHVDGMYCEPETCKSRKEYNK